MIHSTTAGVENQAERAEHRCRSSTESGICRCDELAPWWLAFAGAGALAAVGLTFVASGVDPAAAWFAELARPWSIPGERYRAGAVVLILGALPVLIAGVATRVRRMTTSRATASPILPAQRDPARVPLDEITRTRSVVQPLSVGRR